MVFPSIEEGIFGDTYRDIEDKKIIIIDKFECVECRACEPECFTEAISFPSGGGPIIFDNFACDMLGTCVNFCPTEAIRIIDLEDPECMDQNQMGTETSTMVAATTTSNGSTSRSKAYEWAFYQGPLSMWQYHSYEVGTHAKVTINGVDEWRWASLTHSNVARVGLTPAVGVEATIGNAVVTMGTYNSSVSLIGAMTFSVVCNGFPINYSRPFNITMAFNVNSGF